MEIKVAHSPDSDDAFMFYALAKDKIDTGELKFSHVLRDIESLNRAAFNLEYDVTAISFHAYAYLADKYALLPSGASMGDNYGPMVIARKPFTKEELKNQKIAVPGTMTTAYLALRLYMSEFEYEVVPFDQIIDQVSSGKFEAGLIIHEGQLTYERSGLHKIVDLGEWWFERTGLPLPLGGNVIRRDLEPALRKRVSDLLKASIQYSLDHRKEALDYALQFARDLDASLADKFVGMYVNELTLDYGEAGRKAVKLLLAEGYKAGVIPNQVDIEFVE
ncbi:MAG: ABC transporter substrate-binding protein [Blastocatellia bacterium]|nr:ABC transporter substrate-binding protein [Blastocatellia bacterium]MBL8192610.1 ABC transporter substrate-binding protein [Blastocatellia bacterium]MBN8724821.1 ABC transporter substrate-binding protein [Acidobacteriota bacterium]